MIEKKRNGYRNGHAPAPPKDVLISAREVAQAGVWLKLEPAAKVAMIKGWKLDHGDLRPTDELIAERDASVSATIENVKALWACLFSGAVPVAPEVHPRQLDALVRFRAMSMDERWEDAETSVRLGQNNGLDADGVLASTQASLNRSVQTLEKHWPKLAALIVPAVELRIGENAETSVRLGVAEYEARRAKLFCEHDRSGNEPCSDCGTVRTLYAKVGVPKAAIEASEGTADSFTDLTKRPTLEELVRAEWSGENATCPGCHTVNPHEVKTIGASVQPGWARGHTRGCSHYAKIIEAALVANVRMPFDPDQYLYDLRKPSTHGTAFDPESIVGRLFSFYGVDNNAFKIGDLILECMEDENDGYRSALKECVVREQGDLIFFPNPIAIVRVMKKSAIADGLHTREFEGFAFVDTISEHEWLVFGTDRHDAGYPCFKFRYTPPISGTPTCKRCQNDLDPKKSTCPFCGTFNVR